MRSARGPRIRGSARQARNNDLGQAAARMPMIGWPRPAAPQTTTASLTQPPPLTPLAPPTGLASLTRPAPLTRLTHHARCAAHSGGPPSLTKSMIVTVFLPITHEIGHDHADAPGVALAAVTSAPRASMAHCSAGRGCWPPSG
jgi:hypothetical protein